MDELARVRRRRRLRLLILLKRKTANSTWWVGDYFKADHQ